MRCTPVIGSPTRDVTMTSQPPKSLPAISSPSSPRSPSASSSHPTSRNNTWEDQLFSSLFLPRNHIFRLSISIHMQTYKNTQRIYENKRKSIHQEQHLPQIINSFTRQSILLFLIIYLLAPKTIYFRPPKRPEQD